MKRNIRNLFCILLCVGMILSLSACSGGGSAQESSSASSGQTSSEEVSSSSSEPAVQPENAKIIYDGDAPVCEQEAVLTMLTCNGSSTALDFDAMAWQQEILRQENIRLELELIDDSAYATVLGTRMASGKDLPDIIKLREVSNPKYINAGLIIDLSEQYEKYGFNLNPLLDSETYLPTKIAQTTTDGKRCYIPYLNLPTEFPRCLMINQRWLKKLGLETPTTTDEYYDMCVAFKTQDPNGNGEADEIPIWENRGYTAMFGTFWGLDLNTDWQADENGTVFCSYVQPHYYDFLKYMSKLYQEGLLYSEFPIATQDEMDAALTQDKIGSNLAYMFHCTPYTQLVDPDYKFNEDEPVFVPILPLEGPYGDKWYLSGNAVGATFGISRDCKNPDLAFCFADCRYNQDMLNIYWYGIEGVDYNMVDGERVFTDVYMEDENNYRYNSGWFFNAMPGVSPLFGATQCKEVLAANEQIRDHVRLSLNFGFVSKEDTEVIMKYETDLFSYINQRFASFVTGLVPVNDANWADYMATCKKMHVVEVTAVYQNRYDRMNATIK